MLIAAVVAHENVESNVFPAEIVGHDADPHAGAARPAATKPPSR
jgi:hypothetical protein